MNKKNGKSQVKDQGLDLEHELSSGQESDQNAAIGVEESQDSPQSADRDGELQKLKAERDTLVDRLARSQAEFDNARKRASREQQEIREYAAADTIKALLPILDSFERALKMNASRPRSHRDGGYLRCRRSAGS